MEWWKIENSMVIGEYYNEEYFEDDVNEDEESAND